jgi:hypothetical protein
MFLGSVMEGWWGVWGETKSLGGTRGVIYLPSRFFPSEKPGCFCRILLSHQIRTVEPGDTPKGPLRELKFLALRAVVGKSPEEGKQTVRVHVAPELNSNFLDLVKKTVNSWLDGDGMESYAKKIQ